MKQNSFFVSIRYKSNKKLHTRIYLFFIFRYYKQINIAFLSLEFFMIRTIQICIILAILGLTGYAARRWYFFYADTTAPEIVVTGMQPNMWYAGPVDATLHIKHRYKVDHATVMLDGKPFGGVLCKNCSEITVPLSFTPDTFADGQHTITVHAVDATQAKNSADMTFIFGTDNKDLQVTLLQQTTQKVLQGRTAHLKIQCNKKIKQATSHAFSLTFPCYQENQDSLIYETFIPVECDGAPRTQKVVIEIEDYVGNKQTVEPLIEVVEFAFKHKTLHVQAGTLKNEEEFTQLGEQDLESAMARIAKESVQQKLWQGVFDIPAAMSAISTEFGVVRIAQERGRYAHKALDLVALPRSVVWASAAGKVVLKERYTHSGNTIVVDHGYGVVTMYFHLEEFANIEVGQMIKKGKPVGTLGKTGYANGYHLHWELRVLNIAVDPMQWTKADFMM